MTIYVNGNELSFSENEASIPPNGQKDATWLVGLLYVMRNITRVYGRYIYS
jgi:hypothetical protein